MAEAQEEMNVAEMAEEVYGDCYGPESKYVKLISADGHEFILERKYALISPVLKNMFNGPGDSSLLSKDEVCDARLNQIESHTIDALCKYFAYKHYYTHSSQNIPEFPIKPEIALDLLMAGDFLDC